MNKRPELDTENPPGQIVNSVGGVRYLRDVIRKYQDEERNEFQKQQAASTGEGSVLGVSQAGKDRGDAQRSYRTTRLAVETKTPQEPLEEREAGCVLPALEKRLQAVLAALAGLARQAELRQGTYDGWWAQELRKILEEV